MAITGDYVFIGVLVLGIALMVLALRSNILLLKISSALVWLTLCFMFINGTFGTSIGNDWTAYLAWIFLLLAFSVFLLNMDTEITKESKGVRWVERGATPRTKVSKYDQHRQLMYDRLNTRRR